jgi:signal-transduction protein with cAMP-binding, CBS, and nucleotidyltransferase domain
MSVHSRPWGASVRLRSSVLGSAGRGESLLAMDQDNALVFDEGASRESEDACFGKLGIHIADILHEIGVPYCKGGMAKNPAWRGAMFTWRDRIKQWITAARPDQLLSVDIFFDMRPVHSDGRLCLRIWQEAFDIARNDFGFCRASRRLALALMTWMQWSKHRTPSSACCWPNNSKISRKAGPRRTRLL